MWPLPAPRHDRRGGSRPVRTGVRVPVPRLDLRPPRHARRRAADEQPPGLRRSKVRAARTRARDVARVHLRQHGPARGAARSASRRDRANRRPIWPRGAARRIPARSCVPLRFRRAMELEGVFRRAGRVLSLRQAARRHAGHARHGLRDDRDGRTGRGQRRLQLLDPGARAGRHPESPRPFRVSRNRLARRRRASPDACGDDRAGALHAVAC